MIAKHKNFREFAPKEKDKSFGINRKEENNRKKYVIK